MKIHEKLLQISLIAGILSLSCVPSAQAWPDPNKAVNDAKKVGKKASKQASKAGKKANSATQKAKNSGKKQLNNATKSSSKKILKMNY